MPKISVIIPVYNGGGTIKRCLESVVNQTFADIEIIVVNDGSTDGTPGVVKEINDSRINVITIPNGGQGFARNRGMETAKGEYLAFVDADDTIDADMLEMMYNAAVRDGSDMVQCNLLDIYQDGEQRVQLPPLDKTVAITDKGEYTDRYFTTCYHSYEVCNKLIRKSAIGNLRFRDTRKYFSEDLLFNLEIISRISRVTFLPKPLYNYYQNDTSHMHGNAEKRLEGLFALFNDYINDADDIMKAAASYTAVMVLSYSAAPCAETGTARKILESKEFKDCVKTALTRRCTAKRRMFLAAMRLAPARGKIKLCKLYGRRWR